VPAPDRPALSVAERPRSLVCVMARKGKANALAAAVKDAFGLDLPPPGRWAAGAEVDAIWVQPDSWLLESEPAAPGALRARVAAATEGLGAAVDQSSGRSVIRFAGAPVRSVLATCCRLDLHPRAFGPGSAAMTRIAHLACGIRLVDATPAFDLIIGSTYARWLIEELLEASARYGVRFEPAPNPYRSARPDSGPAR
jgi:heterotetrameric sarcosine oxidase gamma subunit